MVVCKGMHCMGMRPSVRCLSAILPTASDSASVRCCLIGWSKKRTLRDITIHQTLKYATSVYSTFTSNSRQRQHAAINTLNYTFTMYVFVVKLNKTLT
jgi:hypothetical protein